MKSKLVVFILFAFVLSISAQEVNVPVKVKDAFAKMHPTAKDVKWGKEGKKEFEAEFKENGMATSLVYNEEGKLLETETVIKVTELPKGAAEYVAKTHSGYTISEAAKIVNAKKVVTYEAEVTKGKEKKDILFTVDGKPIVKKAKKETPDNDEEKEENAPKHK